MKKTRISPKNSNCSNFRIRKMVLILAILYFASHTSWSQVINNEEKRTVAILEVSDRLGEVTKNVYSLEHICKTIGVPYYITKVVSDAIRFPIVIVCSDITGYFTTAETTQIKNYVSAGGILVAPWVKDPDFFTLFGITGCKSSTSHHTMTWTDSEETALRWIDDPMEKTISFGTASNPSVMNTCSYQLSTATPLATFTEDGTFGIARNTFGKGYAYSIGFSFQAMIFVPQINNDFDAQRTYNGGFEPTSDVIMLFFKGIYAKYIEYATWKHTLPYNNLPLFILSHDVDCQVAMDNMNDYADWELANGVRATYFVTTHYTRDTQDPDYYTANIPLLTALGKKGSEIGSHSVGHLPDFDKIPFGQLGNTRPGYNPQYMSTATTGGTLLGECEVSKNVLEKDNNVVVTTFRPGYLLWPKELGRALDTLGYKQSSISQGNDVLTNFPYYLAFTRSKSSGISSVLELPICITIDPVPSMNKDSLINQVNILMKKVYANYAPFNLSTHPTTPYKLYVEKELIKTLSPKTVYMDFAEFGKYWRKREALNFTRVIKNDSATITISDSSYPVDEQLSLVINNGQNLKSLVVKRQNGQPIAYLKANLEQNDLIIYFKEKVNIPTTIYQGQKNQLSMVAYPNPFGSQITIGFTLTEASNVRIEIIDIWGRVVSVPMNQRVATGNHQVVYIPESSQSGIYFCRLKTDKSVIVKKIIRNVN